MRLFLGRLSFTWLLWPLLALASTEYSVDGALDYTTVQRTITAYLEDETGIEQCLKSVLMSNPTARGGVAARFQISPTGTIQTATIEASTEFTSTTFDVEACVATVIGAWHFPADQSAPTSVSYVFDPHYFWIEAAAAGNINLMAPEIEWSDITGTAVASAEIAALGGAFAQSASTNATSSMMASLFESSDAIVGSKLLWFIAISVVLLCLIFCRDTKKSTSKKSNTVRPPSL